MNPEQIRQELKRQGKSQSDLAAHLRRDPSSVSRMLNGKRQLKAAEIDPISDFLRGAAGSKSESLAAKGAAGPIVAKTDRIPVLGMGEGGDEGWAPWNGEIVDYVARPPSLIGAQHAYAVYVRGTSMEPRYHPGEMIFIHPDKPVTIGSYVLVQTRAPVDGDPPRALVKRLVRRTAQKITVEQFNPPKTFDLAARDLISIHRIMANGE